MFYVVAGVLHWKRQFCCFRSLEVLFPAGHPFRYARHRAEKSTCAK